MPIFRYLARQRFEDSGEWRSMAGTIEAPTAELAREWLRQDGLNVHHVTPMEAVPVPPVEGEEDGLDAEDVGGRVSPTTSWLESRVHTMQLRLRPSQKYLFVARKQDQYGQWTRVKGKLQARDVEQAREWLAGQEYTVQSLTPVGRKKKPGGWHPLRRSATPFSLVSMTRRFAVMIQSGLPIAWVLDALTIPEEDPVLHPALQRVQDMVQAGLPLSKAFAANPGVFPPLFSNMLQIAEQTGNMGEMLDRLATYLEHDLHLAQRARAALVYPCVVLTFSALLMMALFTWLLPPLLDTCVRLSGNAPLPLPTVLVMALVRILTNVPLQLMIVLGIVALVQGVMVFYRTEPGRMAIDRLRLRLPFAGPLQVKILLARVCSAWSLLSAMGHPVVEALEILKALADNRYFEAEVLDPVAKSIRFGTGMAAGFNDAPSHLAPPLLAQMVAIGEDSGELSMVFDKLSAYYDEDVRVALETFLKLIEPAMMFGIGLVVCLVMLAVFLPLAQLVTRL